MAVGPPYAIQSLTVDGAAWYPFAPPYTCANAVFLNNSAIDCFLRSDPTDATTQKLLPAGVQEQIGMGGGGKTAGYFKSTGGTITIIGTFS
jgi:hypothetical protein